jgi:long-chain acyl-CoA synthetase
MGWQDGRLMGTAHSIVSAFAASADRHGRQAAQHLDRGGRWETVTWADVATRVRHAALALAAEGIKTGRRIALTEAARDEPSSPSRWETELAVLATGAIVVAEPPKGSRIKRVDTAESARAERARVGAEIDEGEPDRFERMVETVAPESTAFVFGDTIELTHANVLWAVRSLARVIGPEPEGRHGGERTLAALPRQSIAGRLTAEWWPAVSGADVWWPVPSRDVVAAVAACEPTILVGGQDLWSSMADAARDQLLLRGGAGLRHLATGRARLAGDPIGVTERARAATRGRGIARRLRRELGLRRCRAMLAVDTPALLARELAAAGIDVRRAFAHPAAAGLATALDAGADDHRSVGRPVPGVSVRVDAEGSVQLKGASVPGDDWFTTELHGALDAEGRLHLTSHALPPRKSRGAARG